MAGPFRRARRRVTPLLVICLVLLTTIYITLPPDSAVVLATTFNYARVRAALGLSRGDGWLRSAVRYPVHLPSEVGWLIKTGYGTRTRVRDQLDAFAAKGGVLGDEGRDYLVVGDWDGRNASVRVVDAVGLVLDDERMSGVADHARFAKYRSLRAAVEAGDEERAAELGRKFGWELDALKFIVGMELSYKRMPHKKWYVILDDDTFVVKESLELLLGHLNPSLPQYVGNAVGDYRARFAHGGSGVVISGAAMRILFSRPDVVRDAYMRSLDETWGDRLVATTLHKIGVYIDERYSRYFNGEAPHLTRIRPDRACSPIVSFHGLREPGAMVHAGRVLSRLDKPLLWGQLWGLFGSRPLDFYEQSRLDEGDHVGPGEEEIQVWPRVKRAEECRRKCNSRCLAWTYDAETLECRTSPWLVVGSPHTVNKWSGINWSGTSSAFQKCSLLS